MSLTSVIKKLSANSSLSNTNVSRDLDDPKNIYKDHSFFDISLDTVNSDIVVRLFKENGAPFLILTLTDISYDKGRNNKVNFIFHKPKDVDILLNSIRYKNKNAERIEAPKPDKAPIYLDDDHIPTIDFSGNNVYANYFYVSNEKRNAIHINAKYNYNLSTVIIHYKNKSEETDPIQDMFVTTLLQAQSFLTGQIGKYNDNKVFKNTSVTRF